MSFQLVFVAGFWDEFFVDIKKNRNKIRFGISLEPFEEEPGN
jgi:hypothetical protein